MFWDVVNKLLIVLTIWLLFSVNVDIEHMILYCLRNITIEKHPDKCLQLYHLHTPPIYSLYWCCASTLICLSCFLILSVYMLVMFITVVLKLQRLAIGFCFEFQGSNNIISSWIASMVALWLDFEQLSSYLFVYRRFVELWPRNIPWSVIWIARIKSRDVLLTIVTGYLQSI